MDYAPDRARRVTIISADGSAYTLSATNVAISTDTVRPGSIFVGVAGTLTHGAQYAAQAVGAGAVAVVTDTRGVEICAGAGVSVPVIEVTNPRAAAGTIAAQVHDHPDRAVHTIGVTGTNGKTTTCFLLDAIHRAAGDIGVMSGTVQRHIGADVTPAIRTSIEAPQLLEFLAQARAAGAHRAAIEVSSHALCLERITGLRLRAAGFINLQRDHLDFHETMAQYCQAKASLFTPAHTEVGAVCVDDEWGRLIATQAQVPIVTVRALSEGPADYWASDIHTSPHHTEFIWHTPTGTYPAKIIIPGIHNVQNAALALTLAQLTGIGPEVAIGAIATATVPGRMELVSQPGQPVVIVDYAHTPDALAAVCAAVKPTTAGRIHAVIGATGGRDVGKRPQMGQVLSGAADHIYVTDDDPYDEDRALMRRQVISGIDKATTEFSDHERREDAITAAIMGAAAADTVLILGRGHETIQQIGECAHHLDDRDYARAVLADWRPPQD